MPSHLPPLSSLPLPHRRPILQYCSRAECFCIVSPSQSTPFAFHYALSLPTHPTPLIIHTHYRCYRFEILTADAVLAISNFLSLLSANEFSFFFVMVLWSACACWLFFVHESLILFSNGHFFERIFSATFSQPLHSAQNKRKKRKEKAKPTQLQREGHKFNNNTVTLR